MFLISILLNILIFSTHSISGLYTDNTKFIQGQCIKSKFIGIIKSSEKVQCAKSCDENYECHSSTFNPNLNVCVMYSECESIDSVQCANCLTYKKALSAGECYNPGFCKVR